MDPGELKSGETGSLGLEEPTSGRAARAVSPQWQLCPGSSHRSPPDAGPRRQAF